MALLLVMAVVPTLQIARLGVTEEIAYLLAGFKIHLSSDNAEVVRIVVYYMWCVEGEPLPRPASHLSPPAGILTESLWSCLVPAGVSLANDLNERKTNIISLLNLPFLFACC